MAGNKTQPTTAGVEDYLLARGSEEQRTDCGELIALLGKVTGQPAIMWGPSIVGFGRYRYTYDSGRTGEAPLAGFAIRGREMVLYLDVAGDEQQARLAQLGKHRTGQSCVYVKRLGDLDRAVLRQLVEASVQSIRRRYG